MVTLQALPNEGWQFSGWQGDCDSNGTVIMSDNHTCQAIFSLLPVATPPPPSPEPTLTISVEGSGKVILDNQIECGTSCQRSYPQDSMVTLQASPNEGWQFESWQGECGNNGAVTMNSDHVCTAKFSAIPIFYKLSVSLAGREGEEGGKIVSWPVGIDCGTKCNASYLNNTVVSLAATPNNGWRLVGWQGDCNESGQVTMNSDHTCIAMFSPINRTLTITVSGSGKVNTPNAVECDKVCTDSYANGTSIVLTATPELGAKFASWGGDCDSNGNVTLDKDRLCVATFVTEDSDGDSISDDEEAGAPNNGDGNNDGTPDKTQSNVASLKDPQNGNYVTLEVNNKECNLQEIQKKVEAQSGQAFTPANLQLDKVKDLSAQAFNPASFQLDKILDDKCQQTDVTLFYYGDNNSFKEAYDKYGPKAPSFLLSQGVTQLPDIIFDTEVINGQPVTKLRANFKKEVAKGVATEKKGTMLFEKSTTVDENVGKVDISVVRKDDATGELCIEYGAYDNTAKLNQDYRVLGIAVSCKDHPKDGQGCFDQKPLCWADGELGKKNFVIEIIDNAIPSEADKKLILSIGKPSQAVNIENAVADLIIVDDDLSACPPNVKISPDLKCQANGQTITEPVNLPEGSRLENAIFNDTVVIHSGSRVDGGTFEGEVINQGMIEHAEFKSNVQNSGGRITNATIAAGVTITGGTLAGHIDNQGVLGGDLWLDDVVIEGGELQCIIMGSGTLQNVHISSLPYCDAYVSGFKLTGAIRGDVDKPLLLENVEILPGSHLINVILGENIILPEDVTLENVIFSANFHLTGGILRGNITGERKAPALLENVRVSAGCHLTDVTLGKKVTVAKGITLGGSITNQGGSLLEDVQLEGNTVLSGGQIKGKITGKVALNKGVENQALALLKNLEVLTGSHLKDVAIGENVILAVDVILENVKLPANFVMKGGQLRGIIIGQEDAPARLENVKIAAGSYLESVIIGNNVTLAENVRFGKNVCLGAWGIDALGQAVNTQTCFIGHLIADDLSSSSPVMLSNQDVKNVKVSSTIKIDPDHVGQAAEIVIWVEYNTSLVTGKPQKYARDDLGRWSLWVDDDPSKLPTASVYERLPEEIQEVLIYEGGLSTIAGEFTVYVGYRLSDGTLIYNGSNPIDAVVGNSASIDLKQGFRSVTSNAAKKTSYFMPVVENETGQIGNHLTFAQADTLKVLAKARVDAHDVGKPADILMVAVYRHNVEQVMFTRIGEKWQRWDETLESLQPAQSVKELPEILEVPVYQGSLKGMSGEFIVYVGYRLEEGVIVFNGGEPIHVMLVEQE
jgi:NDP-sugar pyrophosphorylase family protein